MSKDDKYEQYAKKVRIFKGMTTDEVADILHQGTIVYFQKGQTVFHEGSLGSNLFIVLSGEIGIYSKAKPIARCHVGDAFGEMAVLNRTPRCATAAALTDATLFTLDETQINGILRKHIAVRLLLNVIHILSERLENANLLTPDPERSRHLPENRGSNSDI
jgi:CRP-like cAMP-binding protein